MKRSMKEISVYTDEESNEIIIQGTESVHDNIEYTQVSFTAEQVDIIVKWLQEAKEELFSK